MVLPMIEVRALGKVFQAETREVWAIGDVSFSVGKGEFVSIVGPSGCGKSTILNIVASFLAPTVGEVRVNGDLVREGTIPKGLGYNFRTGVFLAGKNYVGWFPGDNEVLPESMSNTFSQIGKADAVVAYTANPWIRPLYRRLLSTAYTSIFNTIFGLRLKYFNGACFFRREALKNITMTTDSPAYMAEILIQLIKKNGATYIEVPHYIKARSYGRSGVLKWKNVYMIGKTIISILPRIYFQSRGRG